MKLSKVYLVLIFYIILLYITHVNAAAPKDKFGRYRSTMVRCERCTKPSRPYEKVPSATFYAELYNTTKRRNLMRGNGTVIREIRNFMMKFKGFYMENGKWQMAYYMNNVGCRGVMISLIVPLIGLNYDRKTCSVGKGSYKFDNVDFNELDHSWAQEREYGRLLWISEAYTKAGLIECWETETLVAPV